MASNENGNLWFLQSVPPAGSDSNQNQETPPVPPPQQQAYQSPNPTNPFNKPTQSPPQQSSPYPQQQGGPFSPPQYASQPETPFPPPQYVSQPGTPYPQQAYPPPQQQGSPYPQQAYAQQSKFFDPNSQAVGEASSFYSSGPPPVVQPVPGPSGPGDRGFFDNAMQMAGVQQPPPGPDGMERGWFSSSKNPLDPPPKMFRRPAPGHYAYIKFQPMSVLAVSEKLQDGFALIPPITAPGDPHPFISHDITEEDWNKFLKDFQKTAHLSPSDRLFQGMANSFMKDKVTSDKVQKRMAENKLEPIGDYLMAWNHYFFHPRRLSVVLAKGNYRFSGETDDYPPDVTRHTKKSSKEKKSHSTFRSVNEPLVTAAEPYPRGSLIGSLLNPLHKAVHDTAVAVSRAPGDLLLGGGPGQRVEPRSRSLRHSDEESDSDEYTDSEEESDNDPIRTWQRKAERDMIVAHRRAEADLKTFHNRAAADRVACRALGEGRRAERDTRREERWAEREARIEQRRAGRDARRRERFGYDSHDTGKDKHKKHSRESGGDVPTGRFRLVICYWDGQREVF